MRRFFSLALFLILSFTGLLYSHSSFTHAQKMSEIKLEKSSESIAIVNMIISLAAALNMSVLAEGVETQEELNCLKMLGCYSYQGFYFSKPIPFKQLVKLLT